MRLPQIGQRGQERLKSIKVLCVGAGGLNCPALLYLSSAGIGTIGVIDGDMVDLSNLQRQVLFSASEVGRNKAKVATEKLQALNPHVSYKSYPYWLSSENALSLFEEYDIVVDGTDNFGAKFLINDAAVMTARPVVYASVSKFEGQISVFDANRGPCYRCIFPSPPKEHVPNCAESGVVGALTGMMGSIQALEVVKLAVNSGELKPLIGKFLTINAADFSISSLALSKDPSCPLCSEQPTIKELEYYAITQTPCAGRDVSAQDLPKLEDVQLIDVREPSEFEAGSIPGSVNIPLSQLSEHFSEVALDKQCLVFCQTGIRSRKAINILNEVGCSNIINLSGGYEAWLHSKDT